MIFGGDKTTLRTGVSGGRDSVDMSCFARGAREKFLGFYSLVVGHVWPTAFRLDGVSGLFFGGRDTQGAHQGVIKGSCFHCGTCDPN